MKFAIGTIDLIVSLVTPWQGSNLKLLRILSILGLISFWVLFPMVDSASADAMPGLHIQAYTFDSQYEAPTPAQMTPCDMGQTVVSQINADWGGDGPGGDCPVDFFAIHYWGYITSTEGGNIELSSYSDDGFRVSINGQSVIDDWTLHGCGGPSGNFNFEPGVSYSIDAWMYEYGGGACSILNWNSPANGFEVVPNSAFTQTPAIVQTLNAPTNVVIDSVTHNEVHVSWTADNGGTVNTERYAVFFSYDNWQSGFAIASQTTNAIIYQIPDSATVTIKIRADNDTLRIYSSFSTDVTTKTFSPVPLPDVSPSPAPSATPEPSASASPSATPEPSASPSATVTPSPGPSPSPTANPEPTPSPTPTSPLPIETSSPTPSPEPSPQPSPTQTLPAVEPTPSPTPIPAPSATAVEPQPVVPTPSSSPTPIDPTPTPIPQPLPTSEPTPVVIPVLPPVVEPTPPPQPTPLPEPSKPEPTPEPSTPPSPAIDPIPDSVQPEPPVVEPEPEPTPAEPLPIPEEPVPIPDPEGSIGEPPLPVEPPMLEPEEPLPPVAPEEPTTPPVEPEVPPVEPPIIDAPNTEPLPPEPPQLPTEPTNSNLPPEPPLPPEITPEPTPELPPAVVTAETWVPPVAPEKYLTKEEIKTFAEIGLVPNNPAQLPIDIPKPAPAEVLIPHIQQDIKGVENGGIEFFGTQDAPQVVGEDGNLTPPAPEPGSGDPIPADAITTEDTFIGQPGGTTFNAPDIAVPVEPIEINIDIPGVGETVQAFADAYVAMANIGNDMSPITRKKAKKILIATLVVGQITQLRRRF